MRNPIHATMDIHATKWGHCSRIVSPLSCIHLVYHLSIYQPSPKEAVFFWCYKLSYYESSNIILYSFITPLPHIGIRNNHEYSFTHHPHMVVVDIGFPIGCFLELSGLPPGRSQLAGWIRGACETSRGGTDQGPSHAK